MNPNYLNCMNNDGECCSKMSFTLPNTVFTYRSLNGCGPPEAFREVDSGGQPCEPNRAAAAPLGLKVLGFVNTQTLCAIAE